MKTSRKNTIVYTFLLCFVSLSFVGCGGDDEDHSNDPAAFDSGPREIENIPILDIDNIDMDNQPTTAEDTFTIAGVAYQASHVLINEETVDLGEEISEDLYRWDYEADLMEGENLFSIKAVNTEGKESQAKEVTITQDPEYISDPPENGVQFDVNSYIYWKQTKDYDPWGSRPDEMEFTGKSILKDYFPGGYVEASISNSFSDSAGSSLRYIYHSNWVDGSCRCTGTFPLQYSFKFWENDDGLFTGGDDTVGSGTINIDLPCCTATNGTASTTIDGNTLEIDYYLTIH